MYSFDFILVHSTTGTLADYRESSRNTYVQDAGSMLFEAAMPALYHTIVLLLGDSLRDVGSEVFEEHDCPCVDVKDPGVAPICMAIMAPCMLQREVDNVTCKRW